MTTPEELASSLAEMLEPNLQFYRRDPSDQNRYLVGPEVLQALSWAATTLALPVLLSAANEVVRARVKEWLDRRKQDPSSSHEVPESVGIQARQLLESHHEVSIPEDCVTDAVAIVSDLLSYRGWPKAFAVADATAIVHALRQRLTTAP